jgi:uncharacterized phage-associated protein
MTGVSRPETTALAAANYIVWFAQRHGDSITNLKLQKLLYYAQGWFLALYGRPLFQESLRAWVRGPVEYGVWQAFNGFKWNPITRDVAKPKLSELAQDHLDEVIEVYGDYSAYTLERMTHNEEPWLLARRGLESHERSTVIISQEAMRAYFSKLADEPVS